MVRKGRRLMLSTQVLRPKYGRSRPLVVGAIPYQAWLLTEEPAEELVPLDFYCQRDHLGAFRIQDNDHHQDHADVISILCHGVLMTGEGLLGFTDHLPAVR